MLREGLWRHQWRTDIEVHLQAKKKNQWKFNLRLPTPSPESWELRLVATLYVYDSGCWLKKKKEKWKRGKKTQRKPIIKSIPMTKVMFKLWKWHPN